MLEVAPPAHDAAEPAALQKLSLDSERGMEEHVGFAADDELRLPVACECTASSGGTGGDVGEVLKRCLAALPTEGGPALAERLARLEQMASRMREPSYSLRVYYDELLAIFPELSLYLAHEVAGHSSAASTTKAAKSMSHRSPEVEYKRTVGALFNVYWLMRLALPSVPGSEGLDGQRGFCFGVLSESWSPPPLEWVEQQAPPVDKRTAECSADQKRHRLWSACQWEQLHQLMVDAGLLRAAPTGGGAVVVDVGRTMAMLSLTVVHDVMKHTLLLPCVAEEHAPYLGHAARETIYDHDIALGYVLRHDVDALPCVGMLSEELRRPIVFTQAKLGFNHGWLVQAEAPAGPLFSQAKAAIVDEGASSADMAFYFVHWLTDLGGAEPTPLRGAEKFTLKFPHAVLQKFVGSFNVVQQLTEAAQSALLGAFSRLPVADRAVLGMEMALSGVAGEAYSLVPEACGGPTFLVYYSPAFLQSLALENAHVALLILADVYRAARALFPLEHTAEAEARTVTVHIGALKGQSAAMLASVHANGSCWRLVRKSATDAIVDQVELTSLPQLLCSSEGAPTPFELLPMWPSRWAQRGAVLPWHTKDEQETQEAAAALSTERTAAAASTPKDVTISGTFHKKKLMSSPERDWRRARDMQETGFVIDPQKSRWIQRWDLAMLIPLIFTAIVTPFEIAFLPEGRYVTTLFLINRGVDAMFVVDMLLSFNVAYQETIDRGGHWVYNKRVIIFHYLSGWFLIDLVSVLPFWLLTLDLNDPTGRGEGLSDGSDSAGAAALTRGAVLFRIVKLLRMLKLARILKAAQLIRRVALDIVTNRWEWTFARLKMAKLFVLLVVYAHWQACIWALVSSYMQNEGHPNWIDRFEEAFDLEIGREPQPLDVYSAAIYWSVTTLTSIGFSEIQPVNTVERMLAAFGMMVSGAVWLYAIGLMAAIATTLDPNSILYQNTMDALNHFMRERRLPRTMRMTLRDYFASARNVHQLNDDATLLIKMSPLLQGTVALAANQQWIDKIWFFRGMAEIEGEGGREVFSDFVAELAKNLLIRPYVSHERMPVGQLYILRRGLVVKMWRFLGSGKVWGEDMIVDTPELIDHSQAVALSYVETYTLRRTRLDDVLERYPPAQGHIHRAKVRITLQRSLLKFMCMKFLGKNSPSSFVPRSAARGFREVEDSINMAQKIDAIYDHLHRSERSLSAPRAWRHGGLQPAVAASQPGLQGGKISSEPSRPAPLAPIASGSPQR